ncbi:S66 peptidase family protein [Winogradskyella sp.]
MYIYKKPISMILKRTFLFMFLAIIFGFNHGLLAQNETDNTSEMTTDLVQPPYLKAGDTVAIVAPSGILKNREAEVQRSVDLLKSWGLNAVVGKHVFNQNNHFAGTDEERCEDLQKAFDDPTISAIWCARGGYGSARILDKIDYTKFKKHPKWVIGYSDITAIHNQLHNEGFESIHGLMCTSLSDDFDKIKETIETFKSTIFGNPVNYELQGSKYNRVGEAKGQLVGGNLTILQTMLGSKESIDTSGKILFIEEIGEYKYHIDRLLQSLKRAGYFENCKGVIIGDMTKIKRNTTVWGTSVEQLILDVLEDYDFPIAFNMPAGHEPDNRALVFGKEVSLKVEKTTSSVTFE